MIPKVIHQIWIGSELPNAFKRAADHMMKLHPDYEYKLWTDDNIPKDLINQHVIDACLEANTMLSVVSDCIRYELLARFGGVYVDCDILMFRDISPILEGKREVLTGENSTTITNCFFAIEPNHPFLHKLINGLHAQYFGNVGIESELLSAGIFYYSETAKAWPEELFVLPREYLVPYCQYWGWDRFEHMVGDRVPRDHWYGLHYWGHKGTEGIGYRIDQTLDMLEGKN
jgi:mannosyltransferase OCH1-like enzyme